MRLRGNVVKPLFRPLSQAADRRGPGAAVQRPDMLAAMPGVHILYIDDAFIVADKPEGLLSVPGRGEAGRDNLATRVQALHPEALVVHRLDMSTSGLLLFARGIEVQRRLNLAFEQRAVSKCYVAVAEGLIEGDEGQIHAPLAADWPNRPRQVVDPVNGRPSLTHWRVLARGDGCTRVALSPVTGRSHQLRVHLQHLGHPIRGDELYAPHPLRAGRLLLHAAEIGFAHPSDGRPMHFRSEPPF